MTKITKDRKQKKLFKSFEKAVEPLMKYLAENHHPHTTIIVTSTDAEIVEAKMILTTNKFITKT